MHPTSYMVTFRIYLLCLIVIRRSSVTCQAFNASAEVTTSIKGYDLTTEQTSQVSLGEATTTAAENSSENVMTLGTMTLGTSKFNNTWQNASIQETDGLKYSSSSAFSLKIIYLVIGSIGVFGNFLTTFVMLYFRSLREKLTNAFMVNQSMIDFFAALVMVLSQFTDNITWVPKGLPAYYFCKIWLSKTFLWGAFATSTFNLVIMTLERYFAIVHTLTYTKLFTRTKAKIGMVLVWFIGQTWGSYCLFSTGFVNGECVAFLLWPSPEFAKAFGIVIVFVQYFIPIFILIFAYGKIIHTLHVKAKEGVSVIKEKREDGTKNIKNDPREAKMIRARQNVIKTLVFVGVCFMVCWGPNQVVYFFSNLGISIDFTSMYYHFTVILTSVNCCINPIIYTFKYDQFKKCLKKLFRIRQGKGTRESIGDSGINVTDTSKI